MQVGLPKYYLLNVLFRAIVGDFTVFNT